MLAGIGIDGDYPDVQTARACVAAFGIPAVIAGFTPEPSLEIPLVPLERGIGPKGESSDLELLTARAEQVPALIERHFGNVKLERVFADYLAAFFGALVDNATEHGDGDWWAAVSIRDIFPAQFSRCQITVFNFGETICESMQRLPRAASVRKQFETLAAHHRSQGFFSDGWTEESLWTLAALQYEVNRFGRDDKGIGTERLMRFFQHVVQTCSAEHAPRMCLVSGRTHVLFDGRYRMQLTPESRTRDIAFNQPNDLRYPPSPAVVRALEGLFPGTLASIHFYVSGNNFQTLSNSHEKDIQPQGGDGGSRALFAGGGAGLRRPSVG